jgi:hypothetical protein
MEKRRSKKLQDSTELTQVKELTKVLFPSKYPTFTGKRYTSVICAKKLSAFIRAHEERNKTYIKLAKQLLFQIISPGQTEDGTGTAALLFELRGIYAILQHTAPLAARALLKEIHIFRDEKKNNTHK